VQFTFPGESGEERNLLRTDLQAEGKIIRLDSQVIAERMLHVTENE
jgi:hypothetical protein